MPSPKMCRRDSPRSTHSEAPFTQPPIQLQNKPARNIAASLHPDISLPNATHASRHTLRFSKKSAWIGQITEQMAPMP